MTLKEKPFSTVAEGYSGDGLFHTREHIRSSSRRAFLALKGESMNIDISGRHFDLTDALKTHVEVTWKTKSLLSKDSTME